MEQGPKIKFPEPNLDEQTKTKFRQLIQEDKDHTKLYKDFPHAKEWAEWHYGYKQRAIAYVDKMVRSIKHENRLERMVARSNKRRNPKQG